MLQNNLYESLKLGTYLSDTRFELDRAAREEPLNRYPLRQQL